MELVIFNLASEDLTQGYSLLCELLSQLFFLDLCMFIVCIMNRPD